MFNLTHQEKSVLLFLAAVALVGIGANYGLKHFSVNIAAANGIDREFKKINLNQAGREELVAVPGIGKELARRIMEYRVIYGSFIFIGDLRKVKGIGSKKFERLKDYFVVE